MAKSSAERFLLEIQMPDGAARLYSISEEYTISQRIALLEDFRDFETKLATANGGAISTQGLIEVMDDVFLTFSHWTSVKCPRFLRASKRQLDPQTLKNFLRCKLGPNVRKLHDGSLHVLDAFLQIVGTDPPPWLAKFLAE